MNCHRARQLISPYLDHQLTGRQMLDLQQHFSECASCDSEARSLRQVKSLLRALHAQRPGEGFSEMVLARVESSEVVSFPWQEALLPLSRPQRGRRLATALTFSCLAVFVIAAPFAPASRDVTASGGFFRAAHFSSSLAIFPGAAILTVPAETDLRPAGYQSLTESDEARREQVFAARYLPPSDPTPAPLADDAVRGYAQGDAAFAGYRIR